METSDGDPFGDVLRGYRKRKGFSQTELAEKLGVSRQTIYNWEVGNYRPEYLQIKEIAKALDLKEHQTRELIVAFQGHTLVPPPPVAAPEEKHSAYAPQKDRLRQRMLEQVDIICIKEGLEKSLYSAALISLGLHEKPDAVTLPWKPIFLEEMKQSVHTWPPGTGIGQVYDEANGELLILGEAGSGKTTSLLQLTRILLDRARQDNNHPIPVVFNLSSWAIQRLPISKWLVEELNTRYQVPRKLGQLWVEDDQILPLLDGLDEVALSERVACVDVLNAFRREHGFLSMVVCSRSADYLAQKNRILLRGAIIIQPLTEQQIDDYLMRAGEQLEPVRAALQDDPDLRELVATPLMLNIVTLAHYGQSGEDLQAKSSLNIRRQQVFAAYIKRMLQRRESSTRYTLEQIAYWLTWLARQLARRDQSEFYLERMQMDWLPASRLRWLLPGIVVGLVYGLFFAVVKGVDYALMQGKDQQGRMFTPPRGVLDGLLIGALNAVVFAFLNGYIFGVVGRREREQPGSPLKGSWQRNFINILEKRPVYGLLFGLLNGLVIWLLVDWPAGLQNGLFLSVMYTTLGRLNPEIQPAEVLSWSWRSLRQDLWKFVAVGLFVGLCYGLFIAINWLRSGSPFGRLEFLSCLIFGLSVGLILAFLTVLLRGLSHEKLHEGDILKPNQGIWNSARNSALLGVSSLLLFGLFFFVIYAVILQVVFQVSGMSHQYDKFFPKIDASTIGLLNGLTVGLFFVMWSGGTACVQHLLLRVLLWRAKCTPWKYPQFLDEMADRLILRRVGGGYTFIHPLLRDYLVSPEVSFVTLQNAP